MPFSRQELNLRNIIAGQRVKNYITIGQAQAYLNSDTRQQPFSSRYDFLFAVACVTVVHSEEMRRTGSVRTTLRMMLWNMTTEMSCGWLLNNQYQRMHIQRVAPCELAIGTTANEALHSELRQCFRSMIRLHQSTLHVKLFMFELAKLLVHVSAVSHPTSRQMPPADILTRVVRPPMISHEDWEQHHVGRTHSGRVQKSSPKGFAWRRWCVQRVRKWLQRRQDKDRRPMDHEENCVYPQPHPRATTPGFFRTVRFFIVE